MRIAAIHQRSVIRFAALNSAAEIVNQLFAHQVFREITPGLRAIVGADACQNTQPWLITGGLQIAKTAARAYRFRFNIDVAPI